MIRSISVAKVATFSPTTPEVLGDLQLLNFIFGSNGTGKTTISRVIAEPATYAASCQCTWKDATPLEVRVLNRDFVEKNFGQLRGVFTLGEKQKDTEEKLTAARAEQQSEQYNLVGVRKELDGDDGAGGKQGELATLETDSRDKFWVPVQKLKEQGKLVGALQGVLGNKQTCKNKVLSEHASNTATVKSLAELESRATTILGDAPIKQPDIASVASDALLDHESNPILKKKVIGRDDVDIAAMIKRLGSSDWVRQGMTYYSDSDRICPFCQQGTPATLAKNLADYFDESFERDSRAITTLLTAYDRDAKALLAHLQETITAAPKFLDLEAFSAAKATLDQAISANQLRLDGKKREPSAIVELESLRAPLARIKRALHGARILTRNHNRLVDNLAEERRTLTADVWRYVLNELSVDLVQYTQKKDSLQKAINGLHTARAKLEAKVEAKSREIRELERQSTSIQPTIDAINGLLTRFGFESFKLAKAEDGKHYKLVRQDGTDARPTLSEGEKTFVVFLYFYNLLKGSTAESGTTTDRIVVFDDPISSLDSDVLFIVSTLIKDLCKAVRAGSGSIKQVFVLTHNVYFHRQVTFDPKRAADVCRNDETFWIIRKRGSSSKVERCKNNPIKSSYELLWHEVRLAQTSNQVEPNVLRRILEYYFTMLGSLEKPDDVLDQLSGQDKLVAGDLLSFLHAGSHSVFDDAHISPSAATPDIYLGVFKQVFELTGHGSHYRMMIGPVPDATAGATVT